MGRACERMRRYHIMAKVTGESDSDSIYLSVFGFIGLQVVERGRIG